MRRSLLAALLLASAAGCGEPEEPPTTAAFEPAEISLYAELRSNGGLAQMIVNVLADGASVELGEGDGLLFSEKGGATQELSFSGNSYVGQLETSATEFEFSFARGAARLSSALLTPPPLSLSGPAAPATRSAPIPITWGPAGGATFDTWLDVAGACLSWPISRSFSSEAAA